MIGRAKAWKNIVDVYSSRISSGVKIETLYWMAGNAGINLSEFAREHKNDEFCATCAIVPSAKNIEKDVKSGILGGFNS